MGDIEEGWGEGQGKFGGRKIGEGRDGAREMDVGSEGRFREN